MEEIPKVPRKERNYLKLGLLIECIDSLDLVLSAKSSRILLDLVLLRVYDEVDKLELSHVEVLGASILHSFIPFLLNL